MARRRIRAREPEQAEIPQRKKPMKPAKPRRRMQLPKRPRLKPRRKLNRMQVTLKILMMARKPEGY